MRCHATGDYDLQIDVPKHNSGGTPVAEPRIPVASVRYVEHFAPTRYDHRISVLASLESPLLAGISGERQPLHWSRIPVLRRGERVTVHAVAKEPGARTRLLNVPGLIVRAAR